MHRSYAGNTGPSPTATPIRRTPARSVREEPGSMSNTVTFAAMIDGLSGTVAFSGASRGSAAMTQGPSTSSSRVHVRASSLTAGNPNADYLACKASPLAPPPRGVRQRATPAGRSGPSAALYEYATTSVCRRTPGAPPPPTPGTTGPPRRRRAGTAGWSTRDDGRLRAIKSSISPTVWQSLGTMMGAEVVSSDSY